METYLFTYVGVATSPRPSYQVVRDATLEAARVAFWRDKNRVNVVGIISVERRVDCDDHDEWVPELQSAGETGAR